MDKNNSFNLRAWLWGKMTSLYPKYLKWHFKMDIGENAVIARTAVLDKNINPQGIHIGKNTWVLRDAIILAHDHCRGKNGKGRLFDTRIGKNCVIGIRSIILPGVTVGDHCGVAAGAVETKNAPPNSIIAGNPAVVIKTGVVISDGGQIIECGEKI